MPEWCCGAGIWWMIMWTIGSVILIVAAIVVLRSLWRRGSDAAPHRDGDALRILEERFARGEIDEDDFRQRRHALLAERAERPS